MKRALRWAVGLLCAFLAMAYVATGWVVVAPGEVVVVRRLGRVLPQPLIAGPYFGLPAGLDRRARVRIDAVRRLEVGLAGIAGPSEAADAGEFLTGDLNLLRARAIVQYRVADPVSFVVHTADIDTLLPRMAEAALSRSLSRHAIDSALRAGRLEIARDAAAGLSSAAESYGLGVSILGVSLTDARPPSEVQPDFDAAQAAQSEFDRRLNEARSYTATTLKAAEARAGTKTEAAKAIANRKTELARARAERFLTLLAEADRSRHLTIRRLYVDALQEFLPRLKRKVLLTPEEPIDLGVIGNAP
ncbi:MAG TPA: protease modulator HflK [Isosphaeraceae bacterium]|jgi:membrane protease subunit HflK|nr:protease modulator HflK [Isosphaeraceae bacterium]